MANYTPASAPTASDYFRTHNSRQIYCKPQCRLEFIQFKKVLQNAFERPADAYVPRRFKAKFISAYKQQSLFNG